MVTKMSTSGEWLIAVNDVPSAAPSDTIHKETTGPLKENGYCFECSRTYRTCECKSCSKCGSPFRKYFGTKLVKGRSHCRICASAICSTCIVIIKGLQKVCTRCHLKQKEDEIITEKALSAIGEAKFGEDPHSTMTKLKTSSQRTEALFEAAKKGHDHVIVTLLNLGCDPNCVDLTGNTPLFYAAEVGSLPSIALLVEKGANISARNSDGWTALHAVAWKGSGEHHVDCAELLLEMGAEVLLESNTGETAADLANRCGGTNNMIQILRAAEVEVTMEILEEKAATLISSTIPTEKKFGKLILTLLRYCEEYTKSAQPSPLLQKRKTNHLLMPSESLSKTASFDRAFIEKPSVCPKCRGHVRNSSSNSLNTLHLGTSPIIQNNRLQVDIQPIVKASTQSQVRLHSEVIAESKTWTLSDIFGTKQKLKKELEELNARLNKEKSEWEERCRKLMLSMASSTKEHEKQIAELRAEKERLLQEKTDELAKVEATHENKLTKLRMEKEEAIIELTEDTRLREHERRELLHLQKNYKLTWIPDDIVKECQNVKCRLKFSQTTRKHHCRCCGRVFCTGCTPNKIELSMFNYTKPVRVCKTCYALVEEILSGNNS